MLFHPFHFLLSNGTIAKEKRYLEQTQVLKAITLHQLNSEKNIKKEPLENLHPLELIKLASIELGEVSNEFNSEKPINHIRILEEVGDVAAFLIGIIKWVQDDYNEELLSN